MRAFFASLSSRERLVLAAGILLCCGLLAYVGLIEPIQKSLAVCRQEIPAKEENLAWMRQAAREIISRRHLAGRPAPRAASSVLAVIDTSTKEMGLARALKRVEPQGRHQVKLWLEGAPFDDLIKWLARLKNEDAIRVNKLLAESQSTTGCVNATITLEQEGR